MTARKIKNSWWVDFRANYIRYRKRSPENSRAGAEAYEAMLRHKLARGEAIACAPPAAERAQTFEQFAWKWFEEYVTPNNKPSEKRTKKYILRSSLIPFFGKMQVAQITARHIEQYKARCANEGVVNKTINNRLTVLSKCLGMSYDWLELEGSPPAFVWLKCPPPTTDYLTREECSRLLAHAEGIDHELILTALRTGMRQGELKGLQWSSINWEARSIAVRHSKSDHSEGLGSPKSNRERHIPVGEELVEVLVRRKEETGFVFLDRDHRPFTHRRLSRRLTQVCTKAGLRSIGWHRLRHSFASHLAMSGAPLGALQALLGHSSVTTTMRYAHLAPSTLRAAIDLLSSDTRRYGQPVGNAGMEAPQNP
ncbi:MAG: site-specific integrase [Devosia sp.]